jgi:hypothetical protein
MSKSKMKTEEQTWLVFSKGKTLLSLSGGVVCLPLDLCYGATSKMQLLKLGHKDL